MNVQLKALPEQAPSRMDKPHTPRKKHTYKILALAWTVLVGAGVAGTVLYTQYLKQQVTAEISNQTRAQLEQVQQGYEREIADLKGSMSSEMDGLKVKVNTLNELLAFAKDSANSKTDNSNQLYTQLSDVKKQLDELQKNLDALK